jgi:hypothetical protein
MPAQEQLQHVRFNHPIFGQRILPVAKVAYPSSHGSWNSATANSKFAEQAV